ncbi:MAG: hypothetical protein LBU62_07360 [Bacteroidales bacterium]|jgi:hypothetical protein|nr:hypothetical protein [Bacteroidales bacterium]
MKKIYISIFCVFACVAVFFSCSKETSKPVDEIIVGKWVFDHYTTDFDSKNNVELQRLLDSVVLYYAKKDIATDFMKIVEFTDGNTFRLYDNPSQNEDVKPSVPIDDPEQEGEVGAAFGLKENTPNNSPNGYGTYMILGGDSLVITNDGSGKGFPILNAKVWANNSNWLTISTKLSTYLDLDAIYRKIIDLDENRRNKLGNGNLNVVFKRYTIQ